MNIVSINNGVPITTTLAIAEGTENEHASVIKLVRTYQNDLERFGRVAFEIEPFETAGGTQTRTIANLNERQATLLMSYMKNTEIIRQFKMQLVKAFYDLAEGLPKERPEIEATNVFKAFNDIGKLIGFDNNMAALHANNAVTKITNVNILALMGATTLLSPVQDIEMTPTQLGLLLDPARRPEQVNKLLLEAGLQEKTDDDKCRYKPTERGAKFGRLHDVARKNNNGTAKQLLWKKEVLRHL